MHPLSTEMHLQPYKLVDSCANISVETKREYGHENRYKKPNLAAADSFTKPTLTPSILLQIHLHLRTTVHSRHSPHTAGYEDSAWKNDKALSTQMSYILFLHFFVFHFAVFRFLSPFVSMLYRFAQMLLCLLDLIGRCFGITLLSDW